MRKLRRGDWVTVLRQVDEAIKELKEVRERLKLADCPQAVKAVRRALKSAEGARRHAERRYQADLWLPWRANCGKTGCRVGK